MNKELTAKTASLYTRNILSVYYAASLADIQAGKAWYQQAEEIGWALTNKYGISHPQACGVIAAVSPLNEWSANVRLAEKLIQRVIVDGETAVSNKGYLSGGLKKVDLILANDEITVNEIEVILNGDKIKSFFANILGFSQYVCVDGHAQNIAVNGLTRVSITKAKSIKTKQYKVLAEAYVDAAYIVGITPSEMQAITWVTYKNIDFNRGEK